MRRQRFGLLKSLLLAILFAVYPIIFLYSFNAGITSASSMIRPLVVMSLVTITLFGLFFLFMRSALKAGFSTAIFLVFFNVYGAVFDNLLKTNLVEVEHFTLLPFLITCAIYAAIIFVKLPNTFLQRVQNIILLIVGGLVLYNLAAALPAEIARAQSRETTQQTAQPPAVALTSYPDIYFIIFDEYAGFDALREYWKDTYYTDFVAFLEEKGFYVAENSHSDTTDTIHEIASRLNLKTYPPGTADQTKLFDEIAYNRVMSILKSYGYTTVVFDSPSMAYSTKTPVVADYNLMYDDFPEAKLDFAGGSEFNFLFFDQTMLRSFPALFAEQEVVVTKKQKMIQFSLAKAVDLQDVKTPKFVYLHVMLPHLPIIFDANGGPVDPKHRFDWTYYLGQHKYTTRLMRQLIDGIFEDADPNRPPVIILQSDHGARTLPSKDPSLVPLENYAEKYKTSILNALYLPGYDYSLLRDDFPPIQSFAVVLNYYFNAGVTVDTPGQNK
ncbi:MAG: hypothetical protein IH586_05680 [Anaerolineaceae bacterium]|nr:hypothetical protein [Anaerolineaceae bacterium]